MKTESHNPACIALKAVPRNASHAIPGGHSTMTKRSAFVRGCQQDSASCDLCVCTYTCSFFSPRVCQLLFPVKMCTCKNGVGETDGGCPVDGAAKCKSCNAGYKMNTERTECIRTFSRIDYCKCA